MCASLSRCAPGRLDRSTDDPGSESASTPRRRGRSWSHGCDHGARGSTTTPETPRRAASRSGFRICCTPSSLCPRHAGSGPRCRRDIVGTRVQVGRYPPLAGVQPLERGVRSPTRVAGHTQRVDGDLTTPDVASRPAPAAGRSGRTLIWLTCAPPSTGPAGGRRPTTPPRAPRPLRADASAARPMPMIRTSCSLAFPVMAVPPGIGHSSSDGSDPSGGGNASCE